MGRCGAHHDAISPLAHAPPGRGEPARAGRAAGEGVGAHFPGGPAAAGGQLGAAGAVDRARWTAHRAAASETGASDGAWLDGDAAAAIACDAAMAPIVTGDVNVDALEDLVRLCVELDGRRDGAQDAAWAALEQAVIGKTTNLLLHS